MSLINSHFYNITEPFSRNVDLQSLTEDGITLTGCIRLNPESEIYKAHFPGMPITPGVCIIQIASELLQEALGLPIILNKVKNAKFLKVINPIETPELTYIFSRFKTEDDSFSVSITVEAADTIFSKLSLTFIQR